MNATWTSSSGIDPRVLALSRACDLEQTRIASGSDAETTRIMNDAEIFLAFLTGASE